MNQQIYKLTELKYCVLPLAKRKKIPLIQQWNQKATFDSTIIDTWESAYPGCNWGVATGKKSGIIVIDIDPRHGGDIQWKRLTSGKSINTAVCKTGGGGEHYYFALNDDIIVNSAVLSTHPGIDIRGEGGQAVVPPSIHESGDPYIWIKAPWNVPPEPIPDWLLKLIIKSNVGQVVGTTMIEGQRNDSMFHQALMLARQGALREFTISALKTWRDESGAKDLPDSEIESTVDSAYKRVDKEKVTKNNQRIERTDSDNADRIVRLYNEDVRYSPGYGWLVWNGNTWEPDSENAKLTLLATESMILLRDEALEDAKNPDNFKVALARASWATSSLNVGRLHAAIDLARAREKVRIDIDKLDGKDTKFLLNVPNGTVNLKTGELLESNKGALITKCTTVPYNKEAECPFWLKTLNLAFNGDQELIDYMQRAIGYSITGSISEQCLFICWGEQGNNGKSTILETIQKILGSYAQMSDMKVITSAESDNRVASSLAKLPGVRIVSMNEAEENQKLSEALIKQITGGDTLQACKKFKEPFEFQPQFKLWIRTNEKPIIRGMSDAIWRRIKLIPFEVPIPASERLRRDDVDQMLTDEYEGILNWCIQGAVKWNRKGLMDPKIVTAATSGYRTEMDIIQSFYDECIIEAPDAYISRSELYQTFSRWAKENGLRYIMTADAFSKRLNKKLNCTERKKVRGQYVWQGIKLSEFAQAAFIV